jgi:type I restriction enzyme M protein
MPGQEEVVVTKEVLVLRPGLNSSLDSFYLLWALSLKAVRDQWKRVVFMQTNREDVGKRYLEIEIPWTDDAAIAMERSTAFRDYYQGMEQLRRNFVRTLEAEGEHHVFLGKSGE